MSIESRVIVALDYSSVKEASKLVAQLDPKACKLKVGKELFTTAGPDFIRQLVGDDFDVFLDLKFHDIPNTVAKAVSAAADLGVWMTNIHASGGTRMMEAAREQLEKQGTDMYLIAVTVLTSMDQQDLREVGIVEDLQHQVVNLARITSQAGLDGVVCSAREAALLRSKIGDDFLLVTPGIRPANSKNDDDQRRVVTPADAVSLGSDYLVIGRPITQAKDPLQALLDINREIRG